MKTFYIAKILNPDLMSRPLADDFYNYVKNSGEAKVIIDFSGVHFVTRSFMDEFYVTFRDWIKTSKVELVNMPQEVARTFEAVKSTQNKRKVITDDSIVKAKDIQELENYLSSLAI